MCEEIEKTPFESDQEATARRQQWLAFVALAERLCFSGICPSDMDLPDIHEDGCRNCKGVRCWYAALKKGGEI